MLGMEPFAPLALLIAAGATTWLAYQNWAIMKNPQMSHTPEAWVALILTAMITGAVGGAAMWGFFTAQNPEVRTATMMLTSTGMGIAAATMATSITIIAKRYITEDDTT